MTRPSVIVRKQDFRQVVIHVENEIFATPEYDLLSTFPATLTKAVEFRVPTLIVIPAHASRFSPVRRIRFEKELQ